MPICVSLGPFNRINLETDTWQDTAHPAIEGRATGGWAAAAQLSSCPPDTAQLCWQLHTCWTHHPCSLPELKWSPTEFTDVSCCPHQHHKDFSLQLSCAAFCTSDGLLLPEPQFLVLTFEMSEIKVVTSCFPEVIHLNSPARLGRWLYPLWDCSLLSTGRDTPGPVHSFQVQAIPASPAELFQLHSQFLSRPWAQPAHKDAELWKLNWI